MGKKSIKKNYFLNLTYQFFLLLTPLVTTPYLSRVLGPDGTGTVSFAESIVSYFCLFATLGISTYGQREISYAQDDMSKRSSVFWETKTLQVITSLTVLILYLPFAFFQQLRVIYLIYAFNIIAVMVDITWLFQGMEEFGRIIVRNIIFRTIGIIYIFLVVKNQKDLPKYVFGNSFFLFLSNFSLWVYLSKCVTGPRWKEIKPFKNIKTVLSLFVPTIAIQIYTVLDKTMIGVIAKDAFENGYYEQAIRISKMVMTIVTSLGTVMIPHIGHHFGRGENEYVRQCMYRSYRFVWFLGIPLCFGIIGTAPFFVPWFFGDGYERVIPVVRILSFLILAIGINNVTGMQYLIPTKRQQLFTMTVLIGACVNLVLNLFLIYFFQSVGAAIASVIAETIIAIIQLFLVRKELSVKVVIASSWHYLMAGSLMLVVLTIIGCYFSSTIIDTFVLVLCGIAIYVVLLLIMRDRFFTDNIVAIVQKIVRR